MCKIDWELVFKFCVLLAPLITAYYGVRKYLFEKNRDYYIKRLNEVYAPLFSTIVKQETYRKIYSQINSSINEPPLIFAQSITGDTYTSFDDFEKAINSINKGLARPNLLIIINQYKQLKELMDYYSKHQNDTISENEKKIKLSIRNGIKLVGTELKNEIIDGYKECIQKLSLEKSTKEVENYY